MGRIGSGEGRGGEGRRANFTPCWILVFILDCILEPLDLLDRDTPTAPVEEGGWASLLKIGDGAETSTTPITCTLTHVERARHDAAVFFVFVFSLFCVSILISNSGPMYMGRTVLYK